MAGNDSQSAQPLAVGSDKEAVAVSSKELRRKKRIKYLLYFVAFVIFQSAVIAIFVLTIMKVRTPRFRVRSGTIDILNARSNNQSFDWKLYAQLDVKNANFGKYKYEATTVNFLYRGASVGEVNIQKSSVGWRSTDKLNVVANLNSASLPSDPQLGADLSSGILRITSTAAEIRGKVRLIFIFSKKTSTKMDCSIDVPIATRQLVNISCK